MASSCRTGRKPPIASNENRRSHYSNENCRSHDEDGLESPRPVAVADRHIRASPHRIGTDRGRPDDHGKRRKTTRVFRDHTRFARGVTARSSRSATAHCSRDRDRATPFSPPRRWTGLSGSSRWSASPSAKATASPADCASQSSSSERGSSLVITKIEDTRTTSLLPAMLIHRRTNRVRRTVVHFVHDDLARFRRGTRPRPRTPEVK